MIPTNNYINITLTPTLEPIEYIPPDNGYIRTTIANNGSWAAVSIKDGIYEESFAYSDSFYHTNITPVAKGSTYIIKADGSIKAFRVTFIYAKKV